MPTSISAERVMARTMLPVDAALELSVDRWCGISQNYVCAVPLERSMTTPDLQWDGHSDVLLLSDNATPWPSYAVSALVDRASNTTYRDACHSMYFCVSDDDFDAGSSCSSLPSLESVE